MKATPPGETGAPKGFVTLPVESGQEDSVLELIEKWQDESLQLWKSRPSCEELRSPSSYRKDEGTDFAVN